MSGLSELDYAGASRRIGVHEILLRSASGGSIGSGSSIQAATGTGSGACAVAERVLETLAKVLRHESVDDRIDATVEV